MFKGKSALIDYFVNSLFRPPKCRELFEMLLFGLHITQRALVREPRSYAKNLLSMPFNIDPNRYIETQSNSGIAGGVRNRHGWTIFQKWLSRFRIKQLLI